MSISTSTNKPPIIDDKSPHCIPFILTLLSTHLSQNQNQNSTPAPFIIGLNGIQGAGKTTLVSTLHALLTKHHNLPTLVLSIDDFYLPYEAQRTLASTHPSNALIQYRGEPGTHDMELASQIFSSLKEGKEVRIPEYDKSAYSGSGDRVPSSQWKIVNRPGEPKIAVVIFEGWCVGFRSLTEEAVRARVKRQSKTLKKHSIEDLLFVNERLKGYEIINECFDAFIHVDAEETGWVYEWRLEQEEALRREKGRGMSEEQVVRFVDGYYPAYELYTESLREGVFGGNKDGVGKQLRLIVGRDRRVKEVIKI